MYIRQVPFMLCAIKFILNHISFLNLVAAEINLATLDSTLLPFCFIRLSNLCNVGHDMQYRGRNFTLRSLYAGHTSKKRYSDSVCYILHTLQNLCSLGILLCLPISISRRCETIRKDDNCFLSVSLLKICRYFSIVNVFLYLL